MKEWQQFLVAVLLAPVLFWAIGKLCDTIENRNRRDY